MSGECPVCLQKYDEVEQCPRMLSCGHSLCTLCLERLVQDNSVTCPSCRRISSAESFPKNFALLDTLPQLEKKGTCELCEDQDHPATHRCLECEEHMCALMAKAHKRARFTKGHTVLALSEVDSSLSTTSIICPEHGEAFKLYDTQCKRLVCMLGVALEHKGHECVSIAQAATKDRADLDTHSAKAKKGITEMKRAEQDVAKVRQELKLRLDRAEKNIESSFNQIIVAANRRRQELLTTARQQFKAKDMLLQAQDDQLRAVRAVLSSAVDRMASLVGRSSDTQLLVTTTDMIGSLTALENQLPHLEPQADSELEFTIDLKHAVSWLSELGEVSDKSTFAGKTTAQGPGLEKGRPGESASFTITAHDRTGALRGKGGDRFVVNNDAKVNDQGDGTYTVNYLVPESGEVVKVSVLLRGAHIAGSPFGVEAWRGVRGQFVRTFGSRGSGQGQFSCPYGVAVSNGEVYVCDQSNHRIQVFTLQGQFVRTFGSNGSGQGQFSYPRGVAVSNGEVYVCDQSNHRIQVFC